MGGNTNFDSVVATTLQNYRPTLINNIIDADPFLMWLRANKRQRLLDGGTSIVEPLSFSKNTTAKSYAGYEPLDVKAQENTTAAEFNWKQVSASITISRDEERKNSGDSQIINLLSTKATNAQNALGDAISTMLFADGTGNTGKDLLGLAAIAANAPTTGTLGGIDRSTNAFWRNQTVVGTKSSTAFDNLLLKMRSIYNSCSKLKGNKTPDLVLADQATYEGYESLIVNNQRFTSNALGDAGFEMLKFKGATVMWSPYVPASSTLGNMYILNSRFLKFTIDTETNFIITPFVRPENQDAKTAQVLFRGNLTVNNCSAQGVIYSVSLT